MQSDEVCDSPLIQQRKGVKRREELGDGDMEDGKEQAKEGDVESDEKGKDDKEHLQEEDSDEEEVEVSGR